GRLVQRRLLGDLAGRAVAGWRTLTGGPAWTDYLPPLSSTNAANAPLSVVSKRALAELSRLRGLLDGSVDPEPAPGRSEGGSRRDAALRLVDSLGSLADWRKWGSCGGVADRSGLREGMGHRLTSGRRSAVMVANLLTEGARGYEETPRGAMLLTSKGIATVSGGSFVAFAATATGILSSRVCL